jgi:hypothetical protein
VAPSAPAAATATAADALPPTPAPLQDVAVQALLQRWLDAQNQGDYEGYATLYATRFHGVKRSGGRERAFQRRGWLADRRRMFGKAMKVQALGARVSTGAGVATVVFTQDWQSGSYRDVGPKQLVVIEEGTELRIAREEMLASEVKGADAVPPIDPADFAFVANEGAFYVLLRKGTGGMRARGRVKLLQADVTSSAARRIVDADVDTTWRPWVGREVTLYGEAGVRCHGQVVHLVHLARVRPHFGTLQTWKGEGGTEPASQVRIADDVWHLGQPGLFVAGRVVPAAGSDCRGAFWARADDRPAVTPLPQSAPDPLLLRLGLPALRALAGWADVQRDYADEVALPRAEHWDAYADATPKVVSFASPQGRRLFWLAGQAGDGCGDFYGAFWGLWEVRGADAGLKLRLLSDERAPGRLVQPRTAVDLDGDGRLELIGHDALLQPAGATWRIGVSAEVPSLDCPC